MDTAIQSSVYVSSPEFAGYLLKRGFKWRKLWKKKWVALHGSEIVYMDKEPSLENSSSMTISKAQITAATEIAGDDIEGNPCGFSIMINDGHSPTWYLRAESERQKKQWVLRLSYIHAIMRWLGDFEKVRVLGVGGTGIVYELLHCNNGTRYAMKEMAIKNNHQMNMAVSEAEMLKDLMEHVSHPNIMHIEKVFQVGSKFYLIFPLCTGGELYEHIIRRGHFTEHDAAVIIRDLISGLHALHSHDILHLDIKPENILFDSMDDDAKIKITDFGLSKLFYTDAPPGAAGDPATPGRDTMSSTLRDSVANKGPSTFKGTRFSMDLMNAKMKSFLDDNELNTDRLKGTVGYMAPELILIGHFSKAADVFAAGVVLYILLCGRPPFHSKSNREVLEKTVRGNYKLSGPEWADISEEAKDLIRKMLVTNPEERISCAEILEHPWITQLETIDPSTPIAPAKEITGLTHTPEVTISKSLSRAPGIATTPKTGTGTPSLLKAAVTGSKTPPPPSKQLTSGNSNVNLTGALRLLSGHVKHLQSEKYAMSVTRLVSQMQQGSKGEVYSSLNLSNKYLVPVGDKDKDSGSSADAEQKAAVAEDLRLRDDQDIMMLMNSDLRSALTAAIDHLGIIEGSDESGSSNNMHRGKLTIEQFLVILKHFQFTPATTRGSDNKHGIGALLFCRFLDRDGDGYISMDDISTAQALIMQRNDLFLKMIFRIFIEALWYPGRNMNVLNVIQTTPLRGNPVSNTEVTATSSTTATTNPTTPGGSAKKVLTENNMPVDVVEPPKFITGRHVASVFEKLGYDPAAGQKVFTILCEAVSRQKDLGDEFHTTGGNRDRDDSFADADTSTRLSQGSRPSHSSGDSPNGTPSTSANSGISQKWALSAATKAIEGASTEASGTSAQQASATASSSAVPSVMHKMDYRDFVKAIEIDDVFLQAIFRKPRSKIIRVVRRASGTKTLAGSGGSSGANNSAGHDGAKLDGADFDSSNIVENELKEAFKAIKVQTDKDNASAKQNVFQKGYGTLSAAFGLAAKMTSAGAAALFEAPDDERPSEWRETTVDGGERMTDV